MSHFKLSDSLTTSFIAGLGLIAAACGSSDPTAHNLTDMVDPFIGTGGHGHVFIGANVPNGLVQLGPSQEPKGWDWCSTYHYSDSILFGFAHTHLSGTGCGDLGDILFFPTSNPEIRTSRFSHDNETARPGYYSVVLDDAGVSAELTADTHTGMHRYSFAPDDTAYVRIDLRYGVGDRLTEGLITPENDHAVSGHRFSSGWAPDQKVFFYADFSRPFLSCEADSAEAVLTFAPSEEPLIAKVGISAVSSENAHENLDAEISGMDFDATARQASEKWNDALSRIEITGGDDCSRTVFYTAMYHAMNAPSVYSDVNGQYRGADGEIHSDAKGKTYTTFSLWDTYRAAHPLYSILLPEMQDDIVESFINIYRQQGKLPVWFLHGNETNCMVGNPGVIVLGDLVCKGFGSSPQAALEAMKGSMLLDERSLDAVKEYGYIPFDSRLGAECVAKGMEYAVADDAVAKVAALAGNQADSDLFAKRAEAYKLYFDSTTCFMRGRDSKGNFREGTFDPFATVHRQDDYCEGNAWQYVWMVPHDPHGLMSLFSSEEAFTAKLDSLFTIEGSLGKDASPDISGLIGQYAHGNEPSHHIIYLYNYAGQPYKAAPLLRKVMTELYHCDPDGLSGNEDVGQMSSWYILSSMGLYQVEPVGGKYVFGSPLFDSATIRLPEGKKFTIIAENNSPENIYIQNVSLNGKPYTRSFIDYKDIMQGGELRFTMGSEASEFGTATADRP